tara:strand:- start:2639 stop:2833 length:195 start_codon:yes stop_codon:yes gene_type:complete
MKWTKTLTDMRKEQQVYLDAAKEAEERNDRFSEEQSAYWREAAAEVGRDIVEHFGDKVQKKEGE